MQNIYLGSCVIIDILSPDSYCHEWSMTSVETFKDSNLLICPTVFAEITKPFPALHDALNMLEDMGLTIQPPTVEALFLAARKHQEYKKRGGKKYSVPDMFVGAQPAVEKCPLVTRDKGRFKTYFPGVVTISPEYKKH